MGSCEVVHGQGTSSAGVEWCCKERLIIAEAGMHCKEAVCMVMTSSESALCLGLNWFFFCCACGRICQYRNGKVAGSQHCGSLISLDVFFIDFLHLHVYNRC